MRSALVWESIAAGVEVATLEGHAGPVVDLCVIAAEGRTLLVSASGDGTLRIWDPAAERPPRVLRGHAGAVDAVVAVGGVLVSAGRDRTVRTWDPGTGHPRATLDDHEGATPVVVGGDALVASASGERLRLWDPRTGEVRHVLAGADGRAVACCGELVMAPAAGAGIGIWDLTTGELRTTAKPDDDTTVDLCTVTVAGRPHFASAGYDAEHEGGRVRLWDPETGEVVRVIEYEPVVASTLDRITRLCVVELDGREQLAGIGHRTVRIWDQDTGAALQVFVPPKSWVAHACFFRAEGRDLLAVPERYTGSLFVWDPVTGDLVNQVDCGEGATTALCPVEVGGRTLLASAEGHLRTVRLWDPLGPGTRPRPTGHTGQVRGVWALHDRVVSIADESLRVWDARTGRQLRRVRGRMYGAEDVHAFTLDGRELLAGAFRGYEDGRIRIWDPAVGRQLRRLERRWDEGPAVVCSFSRAGRVLLAAAHEDAVRIWDPATGRLEYEEECALAWLGRVTVAGRPAFVADRRKDGLRVWYPADAAWQDVAGPGAEFAFTLAGLPLVAAEEPETLRIWNPFTAEESCVLRGDPGTRFAGIGELTLADRTLLVTHGAQDRTVRVWDPATGRCEHRIPIHHEVIGCAPLGDGLIATAVPAGLIVHRISP